MQHVFQHIYGDHLPRYEHSFILKKAAQNFLIKITPGDIVVELNGVSTTGQTVDECK